jgi:sulfide dehydrogenase cytochrome subunit
MNKAQSTIVGGLLILASLPALAQSTTATAPPAGRLLASNCFQCHGTNGSGGFERLTGESAASIVKELREMRVKASPGIMEIHARGYNDAQLQLLANYLAGLSTATSTTSTNTAPTNTGSTTTVTTPVSTQTSRESHDD